jgi:tetratricopeptide (TPR) repeat protein
MCISAQSAVYFALVSIFIRVSTVECNMAKVVCCLCMEADLLPSKKGCACRGDLSVAHVHCLARNARESGKHGDYSRWWECELCKGDFTGPTFNELAETWWEKVMQDGGEDGEEDNEKENECLLSAQNLAMCLCNQENYTEAKDIMEYVLQERKKTNRVDHPNTLKTGSLLGRLLTNMGENTEAETLLRGVLSVQEKVLGAGHEDTLTTQSDLAILLCSQEKYKEAVEMVRKVLEVQEQVFGLKHADTLSNTNNLAISLCMQGNYTEAKEIMSKVLEVQTRVLGPEHPNTLLTTKNLETLLHLQRKHDK